MAKGTSIKRDNIPSTSTRKPEESDTLSSVDKGIDYVKANETAQVGHDNKS